MAALAPQSALVAAKQILWLRNGLETTPLRLQKLLYFCYGFVLGQHKLPLFEEKIYAWELGPVVKEAYDEYKQYGSDPIVELVIDQTARFSPEVALTVSRVEERLRTYSPGRLVTMTYEAGTPWFETVERNGLGAEIPEWVIRQYFEPLFHTSRSQ